LAARTISNGRVFLSIVERIFPVPTAYTIQGNQVLANPASEKLLMERWRAG
jgi:hypothetical protein